MIIIQMMIIITSGFMIILYIITMLIMERRSWSVRELVAFLFSHSFFILYIFDCRSIFHGYWISFCVNICQKYFVSIGFVKVKILVILEWWSIDWSSLLSRSLVLCIVQLSEYTICPSGCLVTVMKLVILIELPSHYG